MLSMGGGIRTHSAGASLANRVVCPLPYAADSPAEKQVRERAAYLR